MRGNRLPVLRGELWREKVWLNEYEYAPAVSQHNCYVRTSERRLHVLNTSALARAAGLSPSHTPRIGKLLELHVKLQQAPYTQDHG